LQLKPSIVVVTRLIPENDGTSSNVPLEKIHNTNNSHILRIPFNDSSGRVVSHWISRFKIWPYLERFALTAERELSNHFGEKPDLIMGNYSDGNLVAAIMAHDLDTTHGAIAHALEKTKYPYSDLYWAKYEDDYHFSLQFTADLIAMNSADFILTSTFQEIGGSADFVGQYESYQYFTMPGLMQVNCGINLYQPKFNVVPPGVDDRIYFSNTNKAKRRPDKTSSLKQLLFCQKNEYIYGELGDKVKIPLLTLARLDKTKNISGLVESFGRSTELQERCNLIIIAGKIKSDLASDDEEKDEIKRMYELIAKYKLKDKIRWLGMHLPKEDTGEVYRIIADHKGFFIQPAIFEGFGLTVLEAMASGLPTFATQYGGPSEIIINEKTGFLINPATAELISEPILNFLQKTDNDPREWNRISDGGLKRVRDNFTWDIYSNKLLDIAALYGFWRHISTREDNRGLTGYCQLLFHLFFKPRAKKLEKNTTLSFRLSGTAGTVPV
jgi:sucrose synthase